MAVGRQGVLSLTMGLVWWPFSFAGRRQSNTITDLSVALGSTVASKAVRTTAASIGSRSVAAITRTRQ